MTYVLIRSLLATVAVAHLAYSQFATLKPISELKKAEVVILGRIDAVSSGTSRLDLTISPIQTMKGTEPLRGSISARFDFEAVRFDAGHGWDDLKGQIVVVGLDKDDQGWRIQSANGGAVTPLNLLRGFPEEDGIALRNIIGQISDIDLALARIAYYRSAQYGRFEDRVDLFVSMRSGAARVWEPEVAALAKADAASPSPSARIAAALVLVMVGDPDSVPLLSAPEVTRISSEMAFFIRKLVTPRQGRSELLARILNEVKDPQLREAAAYSLAFLHPVSEWRTFEALMNDDSSVLRAAGAAGLYLIAVGAQPGQLTPDEPFVAGEEMEMLLKHAVVVGQPMGGDEPRLLSFWREWQKRNQKALMKATGPAL